MPLRQRGELHAVERVCDSGVVASEPVGAGAEIARVIVPASALGGRRDSRVQFVDREPVAELEIAVLDRDAARLSGGGFSGDSAAEGRAERKQRARERAR
jgi:hypothetical protein